jgi:hypothetical protein
VVYTDFDERSDRRSATRGAWAAVLYLALHPSAHPALAYETDQYTGRLTEVGDSTLVLNQQLNDQLIEIVDNWHHGRDEGKLAREVYKRLGGRHWVDKIERWAIQSDSVEKLACTKKSSIYGGLPFWTTRFASLFGLGPSVRVNGVLIGTDKFGHFISQGRKYHRRHLRGHDDDRVLRLGRRNEAGLFGQVTTGVFSNADLVANYEGYLFYLSLFEDGVVAGKPSILAWDGDRPYPGISNACAKPTSRPRNSTYPSTSRLSSRATSGWDCATRPTTGWIGSAKNNPRRGSPQPPRRETRDLARSEVPLTGYPAAPGVEPQEPGVSPRAK